MSFGVPGIRNTANIRLLNLLLLFSSETLSISREVKKTYSSFWPTVLTAEKTMTELVDKQHSYVRPFVENINMINAVYNSVSIRSTLVFMPSSVFVFSASAYSSI